MKNFNNTFLQYILLVLIYKNIKFKKLQNYCCNVIQYYYYTVNFNILLLLLLLFKLLISANKVLNHYN